MSRKGTPLFTSFGMSPSTSPPPSTPPSIEFLCPISYSLMADPVIIPTGHTFERACIDACKELNFVPRIIQTSLSDFLSFVLIPNSILKSSILQWCCSTGCPNPLPISREKARGLVQNLKGRGLSSATSPSAKPPSIEFLCPFSRSLMADPVIIPTGHTLERACIEACKELNVVPPILQTPLSEFLSFILIPNSILKSLILQWCDSTGSPHPLPISQEEARRLVHNLKTRRNIGYNQELSSGNQSRPGEADPSRIAGMPKTPQTSLPSSKIKSKQEQKATFIQFAFPGRPPKYPSIQKQTSTDHASAETQTILDLLQDARTPSHRSALEILVSQMKEDRLKKIFFCNERIMCALIPLLNSPEEDIQTKATTAILGFTNAICNQRDIVKWNAVPGLVHVLNTGVLYARGVAAGAICNLAVDGLENCRAIGSNGAIMPLLEIFDNPLVGIKWREKAGLAVDHLTSWACNLYILEKLKAAPRLRAVATDKSCERVLRRRAIKIMCNLAGRSRGKEELMGVDVVTAMSTMIREEEGMDAECMALMYRIRVFLRD